MNFSFEASGQTHSLELDRSNNQIEGKLDGESIEWSEGNNELESPKFYSISEENKLRIQFYRSRWYVTLNDKPLSQSATVANTRLKKLSTFIYLISIFQLLLGATIMFMDPSPVTYTILGFGVFILATGYMTSKANLIALIILISLILLDIVFLCYTMYQYYNIAYSSPNIPFFVPCMRVLIEIYFLVVLIPGIEIVKDVREEKG